MSTLAVAVAGFGLGLLLGAAWEIYQGWRLAARRARKEDA